MAENDDLRARLEDYRDSMAFIPVQLETIIDRLRPGQDRTGLQDAQKFYTLVAGDLTKLLAGEPLEQWKIEGQLPS